MYIYVYLCALWNLKSKCALVPLNHTIRIKKVDLRRLK